MLLRGFDVPDMQPSRPLAHVRLTSARITRIPAATRARNWSCDGELDRTVLDALIANKDGALTVRARHRDEDEEGA